MARHRTYRDRIRLAAALVAALLLPVGRAQAQIQVPNCEIRVAEGGRLDNASTSDANLSSLEDGSRLQLGRRVFFADATSVSGALVGLGNGASIFNLNVDLLQRGKKVVVRGVQGSFTPGVSCTLPPIECGGPDVFVAKNQSRNDVIPGTYGKVTLENGATLTLAAGVYNVCQIRTGRNANISLTGSDQSTINVRDTVRLENTTTFGPASGTPTPLLNVGGDTVHLAANDDVRAFITAPNARLGLGRSMTFTGAACAKTLAGSRKVDILCAPDVASTTTTTSSTTTSSASTTTTSSTSTSMAPTTTTTTTEPPIQCCVPGSPMGAFTCLVETATQCDSAGGANRGPGTCDPDPCASTTTTAPPTTTTTTTEGATTTTTEGATTTTTEGATTTTTEGATTTTTETIPPTTTTEEATTTTTEESTTSTTTTTTETTTTTTPQPTSLEFTNGAPGGPCGTAVDGSNVVVKTLTCGGLNLGGGASTVQEGPTPDGSRSRFTLDCTVSPCNIGAFTTAPAVDSTDPDCSSIGCNFGTPLPIPNPSLPNLTTCVLNTFSAPATGTLDLATGMSTTNVALSSDTYLTGNVGQPCPVCRAGAGGTGAILSGTPASPAMGFCDRGPRATLACTTTNTQGLTRDCLTGGVGAPPKDCQAGVMGHDGCIDGTHVGPIAVDLSPLTTGPASKTADGNGNFCPGQGGTPGTPGCFNQPMCRTITENGVPSGAISIGVPATGTLASVFCIGATQNGLVNFAADLPGPGAVSLPGTFVVN